MLALLKIIPLRVWLYLGIALAIAGLLAHDHIGWQKAKAKNIEISKLKITIKAERQRTEQIQADHKLSQETSRALQERLSAIERERRDAPIRGVFLCPTVPSSVTESGAATGSHGSTERREPEAPQEDIGPAIGDYGADCAVIAERLTSLQEWERARTH